jgi:hypothetical protein
MIQASNSWEAVKYKGCVHVIPIDDLADHDIGDKVTCFCDPQVDEDGLYIHNSFDGREDYEEGKRKHH